MSLLGLVVALITILLGSVAIIYSMYKEMHHSDVKVEGLAKNLVDARAEKQPSKKIFSLRHELAQARERARQDRRIYGVSVIVAVLLMLGVACIYVFTDTEPPHIPTHTSGLALIPEPTSEMTPTPTPPPTAMPTPTPTPTLSS